MFEKFKSFFAGSTLGKEKLNDPGIDTPFNALLTLAVLLREKGEFDKSIKLLKGLMTKDITEDEKKSVYIHCIIAYKKAGFVDRAESEAIKAIKEFPEESEFYELISNIKQIYGDWEEAAGFMEKANKLDSKYQKKLMYLKLNLVNKYCDEGKIKNALRVLKSMDITHPSSFLYYVFSKLHFTVGDKEKGMFDAITGMKISESHSGTFLELISEHVRVDENLLKDLIEKTTLSYVVGTMLIDYLFKKGDKKEALYWIEKMLMKFPESAELRKRYIKVLWELELKDEAFREAVDYLEKRPDRKPAFKCDNCGYRSKSFSWMCPRCRAWETMELTIED